MINEWKASFRFVWPPALVIILAIVGWQCYVDLSGVESWYIPSPLDVWNEARHGYSSLWSHTKSTLNIVVLGFLLGCITGIAGALLLHLVPMLKRALYPLIVLSQNIPTIILAMLLPFWLGWGLMPKLIILLLVCFFPILIALLDGLTQTDRTMMHYMRMIGAHRLHILMKLEWPHALPFLFAGLKISGTYAVMGAVIAEWLGSSDGLGKYMMMSYGSFRMDRVFLAAIVIIALSLLLFVFIGLLEKIIVKWKPDTGHKGGLR